jgi:hypothetical protein
MSHLIILFFFLIPFKYYSLILFFLNPNIKEKEGDRNNEEREREEKKRIKYLCIDGEYFSNAKCIWLENWMNAFFRLLLTILHTTLTIKCYYCCFGGYVKH